jgi:2-polyprenyl-3-methyl-5-hydroxy-6-metoxy-1,4-benzoquinol methylase
MAPFTPTWRTSKRAAGQTAQAYVGRLNKNALYLSAAMADDGRDKKPAINHIGWDVVAPQCCGVTAFPKYGPPAFTGGGLRPVDNRRGKAALELGCGRGRPVRHPARVKEAEEVCGIDLSKCRIRCAQEHLGRQNIRANPLLASMDEKPGWTENHFDPAISI